MQVVLWTINMITNRCLRISSHRSTMFNNPATFAAISLVKTEVFETVEICQSQQPTETRFEGQQEKNDFLFFLFFPAGRPLSIVVFVAVVGIVVVVVGVGQ